MSRKLIQEFHPDHQQVVTALLGLRLWMERLLSELHGPLYAKMQEIRSQGTTFSDYAHERRPA
jgi:hypothetical protein